MQPSPKAPHGYGGHENKYGDLKGHTASGGRMFAAQMFHEAASVFGGEPCILKNLHAQEGATPTQS